MRWLCLALLVAASACSKKPDFDARFDNAADQILARSRAIENAVADQGDDPPAIDNAAAK